MLRFNDIADRMLEYNPGVDLELLQRAYVFSAMVHDGQERLSGEPYLVHPLEVAGILVDLRLDDVAVVAGLLHDALEDTLTTREELANNFGEKVAFLVEGLTKIAKIEFRSDRERQAENFRKMLVAMSTDIRILLIKLSDRLHNMRTLGYMREESRRRIAQETLDIYVPLAHRLGIYWMKQELEGLCFRALHPEEAEDLEKKLSALHEERGAYIEEVISALSATLREAGIEAELMGRSKQLASIHQKMESQALSFEEIHDLIGFRVIIDGGIGDCYGALGLAHSLWRPVPGRFKDYIALPKPNGYQSLHTTVIGPYGERMEIQIRTRAMHRDAELGIAAHWKYKEGRIEEEGDESKFAWLRQLLEMQQSVSDPHEFLENVKVDLFPDEVFVFTPRGDVITLPVGATAVDFAYAIHSEIGDHCAGAKVNGKLVPLRTPLQDGDTVEIRTSDAQVPRKDWLEFVVSSKARNRIRHDLRQAERARSRQLGREILDRELRKARLSLAQLEKSGRLETIAGERLRDGDAEKLFAAIGYGKVGAPSIVSMLRGDEAAPSEPEDAPGTRAERALRGLIRRARRGVGGERGDRGVRVGGERDVMVRFAGCCAPLPGDEVVGFVTRGRGVTVHRRDCAQAFRFDPERRIDVEWERSAAAPRSVRIRVVTKNERGILAAVTNAISSAGIDIGDTRVKTGEGGRATQTFELWVPDRKTLEKVLRDIGRLRGVASVERSRE